MKSIAIIAVISAMEKVSPGHEFPALPVRDRRSRETPGPSACLLRPSRALGNLPILHGRMGVPETRSRPRAADAVPCASGHISTIALPTAPSPKRGGSGLISSIIATDRNGFGDYRAVIELEHGEAAGGRLRAVTVSQTGLPSWRPCPRLQRDLDPLLGQENANPAWVGRLGPVVNRLHSVLPRCCSGGVPCRYPAERAPRRDRGKAGLRRARPPPAAIPCSQSRGLSTDRTKDPSRPRAPRSRLRHSLHRPTPIPPPPSPRSTRRRRRGRSPGGRSYVLLRRFTRHLPRATSAAARRARPSAGVVAAFASRHAG